MRKVLGAGAALLVTYAILLSLAPRADARPQYQKAFQKQYPKVTAAKKAKCNTCHRKKKAGEKGKPRNIYGLALRKFLPKKKNCKDAKKIVEALTKTEKVVVKKGSKETFGDRLKKGKLPAVAPK